MMAQMNLKMSSSNLAREKCSRLHCLQWRKLLKCLIQAATLKETHKLGLTINKISENYRIDTIGIPDYLSKIANIQEIEKLKVTELFIIYQKDHIRSQTDLMTVLSPLYSWKATKQEERRSIEGKAGRMNCYRDRSKWSGIVLEISGFETAQPKRYFDRYKDGIIKFILYRINDAKKWSLRKRTDLIKAALQEREG